ncbi:DUF2690 domain-containing protein [Streptomyces sp. URMC 129]|uniref:DUF2690 domain-containing protein n=1 Tax=Streptomyces sp. URMC 129 TaxID=3423407 RepID=UPI003F1CB98E
MRRAWPLVRGVALGLAVVTGLVGAWIEERLEDSRPRTCPGEGCEGRDPRAAGCAGDHAAGYEPESGNPALLEVRLGSRCHTVWGRIRDGAPGDRVSVEVTGGGRQEARIGTGSGTYTAMVAVDAENFEVTVCATPADPNGDWGAYCIRATGESGYN